MRILAIGNSFSQDATAMLQPVLAASGIQAEVVNLYIGGCPLERHWQNIEQDAPAYDEQLEGEATGRKRSIREAGRTAPGTGSSPSRPAMTAAGRTPTSPSSR